MRVALTGLTKSFDGNQVVSDVSVETEDGEFLALLGPSGCGKTTILRMIAGLEDPDTGVITIGDTTVCDPAGGRMVATQHRGIGMVFQSYALWPHMDVFQNVAYPLRVRKLGRSDIRRDVAEALEMVGLGGFESRPTSKLSGGQAQRVALARALVLKPRVLLLDEPLSNLDANLRDTMRTELRRVQQATGVTTILVTHDRLEAMASADRVLVLESGRVRQSGRPQDVYEKPNSVFVMDFLGKSNRFQGKVHQASSRGARIDLLDPGVRVDGVVAGDGAVADDEVLVCVRPDDLEVSGPDAERTGTWGRGTVVSASFLATHVEYIVAFGDGKVRATGSVEKPFSEGETVNLFAEPRKVRAWRAAE